MCAGACAGAFLELRVERRRFSLVELQKAAESGLQASGAAAQGVQAYAHALPDGRVQLVLVEGDPYRGASVEAAYGLRASFLAEEALGVLAASLTAAGPPVSEHRWVRVAAPVLGTLAVALAAFAAIFLVFSGWRSLIWCSANDEGAYVFARFENVEADSEAVEGSEKSSNRMQYTTLQEEETTSDVGETSGFKRFDDD
ncbi:Protein amnionless [Gryllus bimaculatus]|nr:Protein amnionless [Gryllus bimaculatus]